MEARKRIKKKKRKNKMTMKAMYRSKLAALALGTLALAGCADKWDDHYAPDSGVASQTLMQLIEADGQLAGFAKAVKAHGLDTLLASDQSFTVWAPTDEAMASYEADGSDVEHFLQNHINRYVYNASDLTDTATVRIKMLNGKFQEYARSAGGYTFAGTPLSASSTAATNGLLHRIAGVAPFYLNIYEQLKSEAGQTDSLAAYLMEFDENTFDKANSTATGKNALGQLTYDSVFVYNNDWMNRYGDLYLEDSLYTVVVPSNAAWREGYAAFSSYFKTFGELQSSSENGIGVPTRSYAIEGAMADSLARAHTRQALAQNIVFRGKPAFSSSAADSLVATSGAVVYQPSRLVSSATQQTVSNGLLWNIDTWTFTPSDCFLKRIEVEAEDTRNRTDAYANVYTRSASQTSYADSVSGEKYIEVVAATTSARTQPTVQFAIPDVLAATYDIYVQFAPAAAYADGVAADSTKVRFFVNYVHADGRMAEESATEAQTETRGEGMTLLKVGRFTFPYANYCSSPFSPATSAGEQDDDCVRLRVQTNVTASETARYARTMRIDRIILQPVTEP